MSDEFIKVATNEIKDDLSGISAILDICSNDADIAENSEKIEQHLHKIKGLAPMMGKENVGNLAQNLDSILKRIVSGQKVNGFYDPLSISIKQMIFAMDNPFDLSEIHKQVSDVASKIVD